MKKIIMVECTSCGGTGLYEGCLEEQGYPVVCTDCNGMGFQSLTFNTFTKRKIDNTVKGVELILYDKDKGEMKKTRISYKAFLKRYKECSKE
jgi:DnaJ-class molecular chaperone